MNIFAVDLDPAEAAKMLCDQHVSKMILESAQMLSAVAVRYNHPFIYETSKSQRNHPCTLWAGDSHANWTWLIDHALAMEEEKIRRTGKGHKSAEVVRWYLDNEYGPPVALNEFTPFYQAMPEQYRHHDPVKAYRAFYVNEKQFFKDGSRPRWKEPSTPPDWWRFK